MSLLNWASNRYYIEKHMKQMRREHDEWAREAAKRLGTTYWTITPRYSSAETGLDYNDHGEYTFTGWAGWPFSDQLTTGSIRSWEIWWHYGPMTTTRQQTAASYHAANLGRHNAEMSRAEQAVNDAAIAELQRLYPVSAKALVNA